MYVPKESLENNESSSCFQKMYSKLRDIRVKVFYTKVLYYFMFLVAYVYLYISKTQILLLICVNFAKSKNFITTEIKEHAKVIYV